VTAKTAVRCALAATLALLTGCSAAPAPHPSRTTTRPGDTGSLRLVAADSCPELLSDLHAATRPLVGPYGFGGTDLNMGPGAVAAPGVAAAPKAADAGGAGGGTPAYSGTNTAEPGADEPDLVKTDGHRIVTVTGTTLHVVDARTRAVTGTLELSSYGQPQSLLLAGDRALVLLPWGGQGEIAGPRVLLVDLAPATPAVLSGFVMDGALVDARQVGTVARVVIRSGPRIRYPVDGPADPVGRVAANQAAVDRTGLDDWLPRYAVTGNGARTGRVECGAVRLPAKYSGTSLLSVLTFDLSKPALSDGDPVTIAADGQTVYANGTSLYVVNGNQWMAWPQAGIRGPGRPFPHQTEVYQFDISGTGTPRYVAGGTVPGWVVNQYALSEWQDHLRVATTLDTGSSQVAVLGRAGGALTQVGVVGGLGKGQRIYGVRFAGPVGYVVTFRQTDPLYTLDLRDPARPTVTGELEIDGYSAYLHPAGDGRLIGVGQAANSQGRVQGLQVSLFDVGNPARPSLLARYQLPGSGHSTAEFDPHAFLYWAQTGLVVVPVQGGAVALKAGDRSLQESGRLPAPQGQPLLRALVVGTTLWSVTGAGLAAADLSSLAPQAWLAF
jgi:uncharacterized secreted protein with C-terminal beta-propeller domain